MNSFWQTVLAIFLTPFVLQAFFALMKGTGRRRSSGGQPWKTKKRKSRKLI